MKRKALLSKAQLGKLISFSISSHCVDTSEKHYSINKFEREIKARNKKKCLTRKFNLQAKKFSFLYFPSRNVRLAFLYIDLLVLPLLFLSQWLLLNEAFFFYSQDIPEDFSQHSVSEIFGLHSSEERARQDFSSKKVKRNFKHGAQP